MSVLSKLLNDEWYVPFNCYEVGHFWTPHCTDAALELFLVCFGESIKIYSPLYLASQIIFSRKTDLESFKESLSSILRSSMFLSTNAFTILLFFCYFRNLTTGFYYRIHSFFPTFFASYLSILIEKPSRRFPLAIYVANIASECLFRIYADSGYIKTIPKGEVLLFTFSMSALLYLIKQQGFGRDPVSLALKMYLGNHEAANRTSQQAVRTTLETRSSSSSLTHDNNCNVRRKLKNMKSSSFLFDVRHPTCSHTEKSCVSYALNGFLKPFLVTWIGYTLFGSIKKYRQLFSDSKFFINRLLSQRNLRFGLFFGCFSGIFKGMSCGLRYLSDGPQDWHGCIAGLVAGPSMYLNPNSTITLYIFWKLMETLYWKGVKAGKCKNPLLTANVVYAISVAQIAFCLLLQPKHMRPSYMKFIDQITGHRFHMINRLPLNILVPEAIAGYEDFFPDLNPKFMSNKFLETMFVWLI